LLSPVLRWTGAKGVQGLADPAGFPVIGGRQPHPHGDGLEGRADKGR